MLTRYVAQRDPDGTWSVREVTSNSPVVVQGASQVGLTEDLAAIRTRKLNRHLIEADNHSEQATSVALPGSDQAQDAR